ncbi:glycosyltransferase family 2 protein [Streptomyces fulvoviolaceus]|uniref:glycosyltransferase family 2 protein n=1 Tax=Streptomyces fulvoviolaceus TaxID=285535 RepID=UPI0021C21060|nr:glycosyltransferase family 2 protein [Streptomyces fulvoviolaceus]MCT9082291.1 glycosyltransferase family 2 protein [Streptomyces fulvoviolaceus]
MRSLSIVIPALNEAENLPTVMASVPRRELAEAGWEVEVIVVDNASTDDTAAVARSLGAIVVSQPMRGYGNAYQAGFDAAAGDVIATGDADCTYPFDALPHLLHIMDARQAEFMTTNRLGVENRQAMKPSHTVANHALSALSRALFRNGLRDSQSGMWIFQRHVWAAIDVRSPGMAFSQEIKNAATRAGFRCLEVPIEYRVRGGEVKLNALPDGVANLRQLFEHKIRDNRFRNTPARMVPLAEMARANAAAERAAEAAERAVAAVEQLAVVEALVAAEQLNGKTEQQLNGKTTSVSKREGATASELDESDESDGGPAAGQSSVDEAEFGSSGVEDFDDSEALQSELDASAMDEFEAKAMLPSLASLPGQRHSDEVPLELA